MTGSTPKRWERMKESYKRDSHHHYLTDHRTYYISSQCINANILIYHRRIICFHGDIKPPPPSLNTLIDSKPFCIDNSSEAVKFHRSLRSRRYIFSASIKTSIPLDVYKRQAIKRIMIEQDVLQMINDNSTEIWALKQLLSAPTKFARCCLADGLSLIHIYSRPLRIHAFSCKTAGHAGR